MGSRHSLFFGCDRARAGRIALSLALVALTYSAFEGVSRCGFVIFDDNALVTGEPHLRRGLSWSGITWAFSAVRSSGSRHVDYVSPLTLLSRLVDVQLFGFNPAAHHLVNLVYHTVHVVLAFLVLEALTGAFWRSAFVAALVAVHPLHVESVAWVAERKDVLSSVFWWLTVAAYVRYVRKPTPHSRALVVVLFALALMAKPMVVTLPFVLLLLDHWPLGRIRPDEPGLSDRARALVTEKAALFVLAALSAAVTYVVFRQGGHLTTLETLPLSSRIANAVNAYAAYMGQFFWPHPLAVHYPYVKDLPVTQVATAGAALLLSTTIAVRYRRSRPYLLIGLLVFAGMLVPVLGLVQSGDHSRADRYMYLPALGLSIAMTWTMAEWLSARRRLLATLATSVVVGCTFKTHAQVKHWHDSVSLFEYTVAVTRDNFVAHTDLGAALAARGDLRAAEAQLREALRIRPDHRTARATLGTVLAQSDRLDEARNLYLDSVRLDPDFSEAHFGLGVVNSRLGREGEAIANYETALRLEPGLAGAHYNLGNLLSRQARWADAAAHYAEAVRLAPGHVDARNNLGLVIGLQGRWEEAVGVMIPAVEMSPSNPRAHITLGRALLEVGRPRDAEKELRQALTLDDASVDARLYLGRCLLALGQTNEARSALEEALRRSPSDTDIRAAIAKLAP
jgi:protein O-mannosyl-transferase